MHSARRKLPALMEGLKPLLEKKKQLLIPIPAPKARHSSLHGRGNPPSFSKPSWDTIYSVMSSLIPLLRTTLPFPACSSYLYHFIFCIHPYTPTGPARCSAPLGTEPSGRNAAEILQLPGSEKVDLPHLVGLCGLGGLALGRADRPPVAVASPKAMVSWKDHELRQNPGCTT